MREIKIKLTIIFNGTYLLLEKKEVWRQPEKNIENDETSMSCIRKILEKIGIDLEKITENFEINYDSLLHPWKVITKNNELILNYGICYSGEEIPDTKENFFWINLEDANKIEIYQEDISLIKSFIDNSNNELEIKKILKLYRNSL